MSVTLTRHKAQSRKRRSRQRTRAIERLESRTLLAGDLVARWVADDLNQELPNGGIIRSWNDSLGDGIAIGNGQPELIRNAINGRSVVRFNPSDGIDAFAVGSNSNPLSGAHEFSVVVVFRSDSQNLLGATGDWFENSALVDAYQQGFARDWGMSINQVGQLTTGMSGGFGTSARNLYSTDTALNDGRVHIAAVTRRAETLSLYVDRNEPDVRGDVQPKSIGRIPMAFGDSAGGSTPFAGEIAEIRFYDGALTAEEVNAAVDELDAYYHNEPPVAVDDRYMIDEDQLLTISQPEGVLRNDIDPDDALTAQLVTTPVYGELSFEIDGSFTYHPDPDFNGVDSFSYVARDFRSSEPATVTIDIRPVYDLPGPAEDSYLLRPDQTLSVPARDGVLSNDLNPDLATLSAILATDVSDGKLMLRRDGSFDYDPQGLAGTTRFEYKINDQTQVSESILVTLIVNSPPQVVDDVYLATEDETIRVAAASGVLLNDADSEGDSLTATLVTEPEHGRLEFASDGSFVYVPNGNYFGIDQFSYRAMDQHDVSEIAAVQLQITSVNDLPVGEEDAYFAAAGEPLVVNTQQGVLQNDSDVEASKPLTTRLRREASDGTIVLQTDGSFVYRPKEGFVGNDSFSYQVSDSIGWSTETFVTIRVLSRPVMISEVLASNAAGLMTRTRTSPGAGFHGEREAYDWIELRNLLSRELDVGGLHLTDDPSRPRRWQIPSGTVIPPDGQLLLFASGLNLRDPALDENRVLHTDFRLSRRGEYLALNDDEGMVVHELTPAFPVQVADVSFGFDIGMARYFSLPTPGQANGRGLLGIVGDVAASVQDGFYDAPIILVLNTTDPEAEIRYTLDGTVPIAADGLTYSTPITIDHTTVLRAAAFRPGYLSSAVSTWSYLFLDDVVRQSTDGQAPSPWPEATRVNGQLLDFGMDPEIVNSPTWGPLVREGLTQIPSLSLVVDLDHLVDVDRGIYVNASQDGINWERPASLELIHPDGQPGFQVNTGVRIRGGFSRIAGNPKHSFRFFFRAIYGDSVLEYPLFGAEGANQFQQFDLRTAQNNAWQHGSTAAARNTFLRDIFSRDTQRDMGQPYKRGRFYHLYINGQYWGLYQTDERAEADYGVTYIGGDEEDYDVMRARGSVTATDGNAAAWHELWRLASQGFETDAAYYGVQGKNVDGTDNLELERHLDIDNLIDYMIVIFYTDNGDAPVNGSIANNFFAVRNREARDGWKFFAHDSESSMMNATGDNTRPSDVGQMAAQLNPKWLHQQLSAHADYRLRFADRLQAHFFNEGALTPENVATRLQRRADEISTAIVAESARWGDLTRRTYTKNDWQKEVDWLLEQFVPNRTRFVLRLLREDQLYPSVDAPVFGPHGGVVPAGFVVEVSAPQGATYYTLDGTDPRLPTGRLNPDAVLLEAGEGLKLESDAIVKARARDGDMWSALAEATFQVGSFADPSFLKISEVHFNPASPTLREVAAGFDDNDDFEFIELVNTSDKPLDLKTVKLVRTTQDGVRQGVAFDFSTGATARLDPDQYVLVVEDLDAFQFRYGDKHPIAGQWSGGLSNRGETLTLSAQDQVLQQFSYADSWYIDADGGGRSLEVIDVKQPDPSRWSIRESWQPSPRVGGTPGSPPRIPGDADADGVFTLDDLLLALSAGEYEDGLPGNSSFDEGDWNGDGDFDTSDLVLAFQLGGFNQEAIIAADRLFRMIA